MFPQSSLSLLSLLSPASLPYYGGVGAPSPYGGQQMRQMPWWAQNTMAPRGSAPMGNQFGPPTGNYGLPQQSPQNQQQKQQQGQSEALGAFGAQTLDPRTMALARYGLGMMAPRYY